MIFSDAASNLLITHSSHTLRTAVDTTKGQETFFEMMCDLNPIGECGFYRRDHPQTFEMTWMWACMDLAMLPEDYTRIENFYTQSVVETFVDDYREFWKRKINQKIQFARMTIERFGMKIGGFYNEMYSFVRYLGLQYFGMCNNTRHCMMKYLEFQHNTPIYQRLLSNIRVEEGYKLGKDVADIIISYLAYDLYLKVGTWTNYTENLQGTLCEFKKVLSEAQVGVKYAVENEYAGC